MLLELPAGHVGGAAAVSSPCQSPIVLSGVSVAGDKSGKVAAPRLQQRLALAAALGQLPSGTRLVLRDTRGRNWDVSPACQATAIELREAA